MFFYARINFICIFNIFFIQKLLFFFACSEFKNEKKNKKIYIRFLCQKYKNVFEDFCFFLYKKLSIVLLFSHWRLILNFIFFNAKTYKKTLNKNQKNFQLNFSLIWFYCLKAFYILFFCLVHFVTHKNRKIRNTHYFTLYGGVS